MARSEGAARQAADEAEAQARQASDTAQDQALRDGDAATLQSANNYTDASVARYRVGLGPRGLVSVPEGLQHVSNKRKLFGMGFIGSHNMI